MYQIYSVTTYCWPQGVTYVRQTWCFARFDIYLCKLVIKLVHLPSHKCLIWCNILTMLSASILAAQFNSLVQTRQLSTAPPQSQHMSSSFQKLLSVLVRISKGSWSLPSSSTIQRPRPVRVVAPSNLLALLRAEFLLREQFAVCKGHVPRAPPRSFHVCHRAAWPWPAH